MNDLQQLLKGKTPVSVLQEICSKKKLTPTYNLLANEGPVHEPVFVMKAQAGDFQGTVLNTILLKMIATIKPGLIKATGQYTLSGVISFNE